MCLDPVGKNRGCQQISCQTKNYPLELEWHAVCFDSAALAHTMPFKIKFLSEQTVCRK